MADRQVIDSEALNQCVTKYKEALERLKDCTTTFQGALEALRTDWTGKAFLIMSGKVAQMTGNIIKSYGKLTDAIDELTEYKGLGEDTESKIKSMVGGLDIGDQSPFQG